MTWQVLGGVGTFVLLFGFLPGFTLRLLVKIYPKDDPRRRELVAELYVLGRTERLLFVGEQLETVLFEGLPARVRHFARRWFLIDEAEDPVARIDRFLIAALALGLPGILAGVGSAFLQESPLAPVLLWVSWVLMGLATPMAVMEQRAMWLYKKQER